MTDKAERVAPRVMATFCPQGWVGDYAMDVDPEGDTEWDATEEFNSLPDDHRESLLAEMRAEDDRTILDGDDVFKGDPNTPEWVREWSGPFSLWLQLIDSCSETPDGN